MEDMEGKIAILRRPGTKALGLILCLSVACIAAIPIFGAASAPAQASAGFCKRDRTIQSFGSRPKQGFSARLVAAPGRVVAGHYASMRIVNNGADQLSYGISPRVQHWESGSWMPMPLPPGYVAPALSFLVSPETVSGCSGPPTHGDWPAGKYRWQLSVTAESRNGPTRDHVLRATFWLRSPATARPGSGA